MARWRRTNPARPLLGYRDTGEMEHYTRRDVVRSWLVLLVMVIVYLALMLPIYFLEPGLR
jgi:predicted ABC-type exoprotein transport system permease subunit